MFNRRAVLYGDVGFGRDGVLSLPKPSFLLSQKPSLGRIVDGLLPQKHAQLRAADFFALSPGFPAHVIRRSDAPERCGRLCFRSSMRGSTLGIRLNGRRL